jgi:hypothetical protein
MDASHYELTSKATNLIGGLTREKTLAQQTAFEIGRGEQANVSAAHQALIHRAQCKQAARHSEFTATREEK